MSLRIIQVVVNISFLICFAMLLPIAAAIDAGVTAAHMCLYFGPPLVVLALSVEIEKSMRTKEAEALAVYRRAHSDEPRQRPQPSHSMMTDHQRASGYDRDDHRYYQQG
jgi:hypothetical protein